MYTECCEECPRPTTYLLLERLDTEPETQLLEDDERQDRMQAQLQPKSQRVSMRRSSVDATHPRPAHPEALVERERAFARDDGAHTVGHAFVRTRAVVHEAHLHDVWGSTAAKAECACCGVDGHETHRQGSR